MKRPFLLAILLIHVLFACRSSEIPPDTVVIGIESAPTNLDPRLATDANSSRILGLIFNGLVRQDSKGRLLPDLADRWTIQDSRTYLFHLRKGVHFHNGALLSSRDVKYTIDSILDPATGSPHRSTYEMIESIETPDDDTVLFRLKEPFAPFLLSMTMGILPRKETSRKKDRFASNPVGTGPFRLKESRPGESYTLAANPAYFGGPPKLKKVIFKIISDSTVRFLEMRKGTINLLINGIELDYIPLVRRNPDLKTVTSPGVNYSYIGLNLTDPILKKRAVRRAIAQAIDRKAIIRYLLKGTAHSATGLLSPMNWAYNGNVTTCDWNPDQSKRLLDRAGYPDPDGDGPETRFTLTLKTSEDALRKRIAAVLQQQLRKVGIGLQIESYEWGTFYGDIKSGNFQLYTLSWVGITEPDIYYYIFYSGNTPPRGANRGRYSNPEMDDLLIRARHTLNPSRRKKYYARIQEILARDLPYISLWYYDNIAVMRKNLHGFALDPRGDLFSLKDAWIAK